jgi:cytochrome b561
LRLRSAQPAAVTTGYPALDRMAPLMHYGLYLLMLLMVGTGYATGILAGLPHVAAAL